MILHIHSYLHLFCDFYGNFYLRRLFDDGIITCITGMIHLIGPYPHERINPVVGQSQEKFCISSAHQQGVFSTVHAFHGDVARAKELRRAVAHFQLQLGVVAEGGQVVRGKGVPQHIRLPVGEAGFPVQACPEASPVRRTDPFVPGAADRSFLPPTGDSDCTGSPEYDSVCRSGMSP